MKPTFAALILLMLATPSCKPDRAVTQNDVAMAVYWEGQLAYMRGDYATAVRKWRSAAEQNYAQAQARLGQMYYEGQGVLRDDTEAFRWFMKAADQGHAYYYHLGRMYQFGEGVERDYVQAHKWYSLWARIEPTMSAGYRDAVAKKMTPAQIAEAQNLAREWRAAFKKRNGK